MNPIIKDWKDPSKGGVILERERVSHGHMSAHLGRVNTSLRLSSSSFVLCGSLRDLLMEILIKTQTSKVCAFYVFVRIILTPAPCQNRNY